MLMVINLEKEPQYSTIVETKYHNGVPNNEESGMKKLIYNNVMK